jgi:hypothetical protein
MMTTTAAAVADLCTGRVSVLLEDGKIGVELDDAHSTRVECDLLHGAGPDVRLFAGDQVLLWRSPTLSRPLIMGRIGETNRPPSHDIPDQLVLEAHANLTLKCGDGSITIRKDGKILIKGKNLVSLATETNRIKGGSVAIN